MLAIFTIIVVWSSIDRVRRTSLEVSEQKTGVEDRVYFPLPPVAPEQPPVAVHLEGRPLYAFSYKPVSIHDSDVRRVAKDAATGLSIYEAADENDSRKKELEGAFLLKAGPGQYVKLEA